MKNNLTFILINIISGFIIEQITPLPWWTFLAATFCIGLLFGLKGWTTRPFLLGFIAGFINWFMMTIILHLVSQGILMNKVAAIFHLPSYILFIVIGVVGGGLTGLACYAGYNVTAKEDVLAID